jgi:hypothetical protein
MTSWSGHTSGAKHSGPAGHTTSTSPQALGAMHSASEQHEQQLGTSGVAAWAVYERAKTKAAVPAARTAEAARRRRGCMQSG